MLQQFFATAPRLCWMLIGGFLLWSRAACPPATAMASPRNDEYRLAPYIMLLADQGENGYTSMAGAIGLQQPGFYKILALVDYNSGDAQRNESFFLRLLPRDGAAILPADPNAGPFKVVVDLSGPPQKAWREAGVFYLPAGQIQIEANHYAKIAPAYPVFLNGDIAGPESVHLDSLRIMPDRPVDLAVDAAAHAAEQIAVGTAVYALVRAGELFRYRTRVRNVKNTTSAAALLTYTLADSLVAETVTPLPDTASATLLGWYLPPLAGVDSFFVEVGVRYIGRPRKTPVPLRADFIIRADGDGNTANDSAHVITYLAADSAHEVAARYDLALTYIAEPATLALPPPDSSSGRSEAEIGFTVRLFNAGPASAESIFVSCTLPAEIVPLDPAGQPAGAPGQTVRWHVESLSPMQQDSLRFRARIALPLAANPQTLISVARVRAPGDTNGSNNADTAAIQIAYRDREPAGQTPTGPESADILVVQHAHTDSFRLVARDTIFFVQPGETYARHIIVRNSSAATARRISVRCALSQFEHPQSYSVPPQSIAGDTLLWDLPSLAPHGRHAVSFRVSVAADLPETVRFLTSFVRIAAENERPAALANNSSLDTLFTYFPWQNQPGEQPEIEAFPRRVEVGQSVSLRVRFPVPPAAWRIRARFADGSVDSTFADPVIRSIAPRTAYWHSLPEVFQNARLITRAETEAIAFELLVRYIDGRRAIARTTVTVQSRNAFVLDRNVFEPGRENLGIRFKLSSNRTARLDLYDIAGRHITRIIEKWFPAGWQTYEWDGLTGGGEKVVSGIYLVTIRSGEFASWKRCILVR